MAASAQANLNLASGWPSGQWYNPARDGEGFYVEVIGEGDNLQIAVAMYSYDAEGNQLWLVGNLPILDTYTGARVPVVLIEGPVWGTAYDPADRSTTDFGTIVVRFPTCDTALFDVQSNVQGLESGTYSLVRLTELVGMDCTEPPPPDTLPSPSPGGDITPGLWSGEGVCFSVNTEGTYIVESDQCDGGKSYSGSGAGVQVDYDGTLDPDVCNANVACVGDWRIYESTSEQGVTSTQVHCVNQGGGIGVIKFVSGNSAKTLTMEGQTGDGRLCVSSTDDVTPVQ